MLQPFAATDRYFISVFLFCQQLFKTFFAGHKRKVTVYRFSCRHGSCIRKTTNELEQHKKNVRKKWDYYQLPADVFYYDSDSGYPSGKLLL